MIFYFCRILFPITCFPLFFFRTIPHPRTVFKNSIPKFSSLESFLISTSTFPKQCGFCQCARYKNTQVVILFSVISRHSWNEDCFEREIFWSMEIAGEKSRNLIYIPGFFASVAKNCLCIRERDLNHIGAGPFRKKIVSKRPNRRFTWTLKGPVKNDHFIAWHLKRNVFLRFVGNARPFTDYFVCLFS